MSAFTGMTYFIENTTKTPTPFQLAIIDKRHLNKNKKEYCRV
jgi:hypothetical protein